MTAERFSSLADHDLVELLNNGAVGVLPTDTVYGVVARAVDPSAVERLYRLKPRELQPGTLIVGSIEQLWELGFETDDLERARQYWPSSTSVVINATNVPVYLRQKRETLAVRIPNRPELAALLQATGPLMTSSANEHGQPTSTSADQARGYFGDVVDFYVDYGDIGEQPASTIIGFDDAGELIIYRQGADLIVDNTS